MKNAQFLVWMIAVLSASASARPAYQLTELEPLPGYSSSCALGINDQGLIVGYSYNEQADPPDSMASMWRGAQVISLGTLGGSESLAAAVNRYGRVVGSSGVPGGMGHAFSFRQDKSRLHDLLPGQEASAFALNDRGMVVGQLGSSSEAFMMHHGVVTQLGTLGGESSWAAGINNDGTIVGVSQIRSDTGELRPFLYAHGAMTDLGSLGGNAGATAINAAGVVVGWSEQAGAGLDGPPVQQAFVYSGGALQALENPPKMDTCSASALNDRDEVVGYCSAGLGPYRAVKWRGGKVYDLFRLIDDGVAGKWKSSTANGVNRRGQIAGCGWLEKGRRGFALNPIRAIELDTSTERLSPTGDTFVMTSWRKTRPIGSVAR